MIRGKKDISISFTLSESSVTLNEPVFVDFSVHNRLQESIRLDLGHNRKSNFEFTITEPDGSIVSGRRPGEEGLGRLGDIPLKPDERYSQRLMVNEWYQFIELGDYKIEIKLTKPLITRSGALIEPEPSGFLPLRILPLDQKRLNQVCQNLLHIAIESPDIEEAAEAALALSYVNDPATVPYLAKGLKERGLIWQYAIPGLARIANAEAIEILVSTMKSKDPELGASLARFFLHELKEKIDNLELKEKIERALQTN